MSHSAYPTAPVSLKSGCKVNLSLEITGLRSDGYHTLHSYFLPLQEPSDTLSVLILGPREAGSHCSSGCVVQTRSRAVDPADNTITRAYQLYCQAVPEVPFIQVKLDKWVPAGAGLGGGSANAAAVLVFINKLMRESGQDALDEDELISLASQVGADVPFFILGRPAWVGGIGEIIRPDSLPLQPYKDMRLVLVCPRLEVSTPWAYSEWDKMVQAGANALTSEGRQDSNNTAEAIRFINSLEEPVFSSFPQLREIKEELLGLGAEEALMSGSGSSIFGLFSSEVLAEKAERAFKARGLSVYSQAIYTGV